MNDAPESRGIDHREFLDLIKEFSEKLRRACDAYDARRTKWSRGVVAVCQAIAILVVSLSLLSFKANPGIPRIDWQYDGPAIIMQIVFWMLVALASVYWVRQSWADIYRSQFDIRPLAAALEKLVSRASQLEDRSISTADEKVIFDLRIAEAESALEYADWVTRSRSIWYIFRRPLTATTRQYRSRSVSL